MFQVVPYSVLYVLISSHRSQVAIWLPVPWKRATSSWRSSTVASSATGFLVPIKAFTFAVRSWTSYSGATVFLYWKNSVKRWSPKYKFCFYTVVWWEECSHIDSCHSSFILTFTRTYMYNIYIYIYTYICIFTCICIHTDIYIYLHTDIHICIF